MKNDKFWIVYALKNDGRFERFETLENAIIDAKRRVVSAGCDVFILECIGVARQPVPAIEVTML